MSSSPEGLAWSLCTSWPARGAIAVMQVRGEGPGIDKLVAGLGAGAVGIGRVAVRHVAGIDKCVLARFDERTLLIFPHAGKRIIERLGDALAALGVARKEPVGVGNAREAFPEARSEVEARMLAALATAASPLAIDLLLDQPRRWNEVSSLEEVDADTARVLGRLNHPPLVAAVGPPNVGKSSLLNALAGRSMSVVADKPGTTRDHVGAMLDLGELVVRWVDCPGFVAGEADDLQREAQRMAVEVAGAADLVVQCGDGQSGFLDATLFAPAAKQVWASLRSDLCHRPESGPVDALESPQHPPPVRVSARTGEGLAELVETIREVLVPAAALADPRAWRFWDPGPK